MPEAEVTYADVKFIRTKRGSVLSSDNITYSNVKISNKELPADSHQNEWSWRSKVTWERVALLVLSGFLVAAVIALGVFIQKANNLNQSVQTLKEENETLRKNISDLTCLKCGADWEERGGKCYYFSSIQRSWKDSRRSCRGVGGDLVKIDSREEQEFLVKRLRLEMIYAEVKFWIGLTKSETEGSWLWVDGSRLNESLNFFSERWFNKEDCVVMGKKRYYENLKNWFSKHCFSEHKSICERPAETFSLNSVIKTV